MFWSQNPPPWAVAGNHRTRHTATATYERFTVIDILTAKGGSCFFGELTLFLHRPQRHALPPLIL